MIKVLLNFRFVSSMLDIWNYLFTGQIKVCTASLVADVNGMLDLSVYIITEYRVISLNNNKKRFVTYIFKNATFLSDRSVRGQPQIV